MEATAKNNTWLVFLALGALLLIALLAMPLELPPLGQVKPRAHAVERHGEDAVAARKAVLTCGDGLRAQFCPRTSVHGPSVAFWCETGGFLCPGMYLTLGGVEKTCFTRPCEQWRKCND
ncbi:MAG TPA: hypothetical protein VMY40_02340 [Anaerolineae bacterium]|nr:hypothetical protein [Anaerolineae bacterium]